jgi:hypothetical protein
LLALPPRFDAAALKPAAPPAAAVSTPSPPVVPPVTSLALGITPPVGDTIPNCAYCCIMAGL